MTTIDKIRNEIERRMGTCDANSKTPNQLLWAELAALIPFLDTLEAETSYDTQKYTPSPFVDIGDVARVQFASHAKVFDKKRKAVFDWEQFKEVAGIFYGFGKKDPSDTLESEKPNDLEEPESEDLEDCLELNEAARQYERSRPFAPDESEPESTRKTFKAGADWQKDKDTEAVIVAEDRGFLKGADWARAKMMEGAVDVHIVKSYNPCTEEGKPTLHGVELLYEDEGKPYLVAGENARIVILPREDEK